MMTIIQNNFIFFIDDMIIAIFISSEMINNINSIKENQQFVPYSIARAKNEALHLIGV